MLGECWQSSSINGEFQFGKLRITLQKHGQLHTSLELGLRIIQDETGYWSSLSAWDLSEDVLVFFEASYELKFVHSEVHMGADGVWLLGTLKLWLFAIHWTEKEIVLDLFWPRMLTWTCVTRNALINVCWRPVTPPKFLLKNIPFLRG